MSTTSLPETQSQEAINYLIRRFAVSKHQARRLVEQFGSDKHELDLLLSGKSTSPESRKVDDNLTVAEVTFGRVC